MRISDRSVQRLIRLWLRAPIEENEGECGTRLRKKTEGTPQGGVISPLLANAYLDWLDKLFMARSGPGHWAGARIVRYADDFQIFARHITPRITEWVSALVEGRMGLTLNAAKTTTATVKPGGDPLDFLGYRFQWERSRWPGGRPWLSLKPSPRSQQRFRDRVRSMTASNRGAVPIDKLCGQLNSYLAGWVQYFGAFHRGNVINKADMYVYDRMVRHLKSRSQRGVRPSHGATWYRFVRQHLGVSRLTQLRPSTVTQ
jgi:RNA-directed DNA polymerase